MALARIVTTTTVSKKKIRAAVLGILIAAGLLIWLSRPHGITADSIPPHTPDANAGERVFWAAGCASCHATPVNGKRAKGAAKRLLGGGMELNSEFGVFRVPNISPHRQDGIGDWSMLDFVNAMQHGVSPEGKHYYPSFPYTSYARMTIEDVMDLKGFIDTLPPVDGVVAEHTLDFPWSSRGGIGLWKLRYLGADPVLEISGDEELLRQGRYLVEGAGHCAECHTPRDRFGGLEKDRWMAGAPAPEGEGKVPNITSGGKNLLNWSVSDIAYYLESGFTPDFDTVGGSMVAVQENMALLTPEDRQAIATYLKAVPIAE